MGFKQCIISLFVCLFSFTTQGDEYFHESYDWEEDPVVHQLSGQEKDELAVFFKDKRVIEYGFDTYTNSIIQYVTIHKIIKVNSDKAIEEYNKVYIPMKSALDVLNPKARVIKKDGEVQALDTSDIKSVEDIEGQGAYSYFAIEGAEIGSEIEYIYTVKKSGGYQGDRQIFQSDVLKKNVSFELFMPDNIFFDTKSYNGFPEMKIDTSLENKNRYWATADSIPALPEERYSAYTANLMKVEFKLGHTASSSGPAITYGDAAEKVFKILNEEDLSRGTEKDLEDILEELELKDKDQEEKIRLIERHVKDNFNIVEQMSEQFVMLEGILETKNCTELGMVKLFLALFEKTEIPFRVGLTSDRFQIKFDPDFETFSVLQHYFFYFPDIEKYMAPSKPFYRLGYIPYEWTNNYGLFVKPVALGDYKTGVGEVKFIPPLPYDKSKDVMEVNIDFDGNFSELTLDIKRKLSGFSGGMIQPIYALLPEKKERDKISETFLKFVGEDAEVSDYSVKNVAPEDVLVKPFIVEGKVTTQSLIERAGNKYLFKIGEVIGRQVEMYQEEERKLPIENDFNRTYERTITFNIPDGYKVSNLEKLNNEVYHKKDGERTMTFTSTYKKEGDKIKVHIIEYYNQIKYPASMFDKFQEVINAAADFNKVVLFLEKK